MESLPTKRPHRKRCKRYDVPGHAHYLTFSCFRRQPFLRGERACRWLAEAIGRARTAVPFDLWAYVFMPEHVHLLIRPRPAQGISGILKAIKQPVAVESLRFVKANEPGFLPRMAHVQSCGKTSHRFWQRGGGYDKNIWTDAEAHEKIAYIHANPVRRGLVEHPREWFWSSWRAWEEGVEKPLRVDRDTAPSMAS